MVEAARGASAAGSGQRGPVTSMELLEVAAECPIVEFRVISETHGPEHIATGSDAGNEDVVRGPTSS